MYRGEGKTPEYGDSGKMWVTRQGTKEIGKAAVEYFHAQFMEDGNNQEFKILDFIPKLVNDN